MGGIVKTFLGRDKIAHMQGPEKVQKLQWSGNIDPTGVPDTFGGEALAGEYMSAAEAQNLGLGRGIDQLNLGMQRAQDQYGSTKAMMQPYLDAGQKAFDLRAAMSGAMGADAQQMAYDQIQESPAQRFIRERAQKALLQNQAILGDLGGGRTRLGLQEQAMGFAMQDADNMFNKLGAVASPTQAYISQLGSLGAGLSGLGTQYDTGIAGMYTQQGVNTGAGGLGAAGAMVDEYGKLYQADINKFNQLVNQQAAKNQFDASQQEVDFRNISNQMNVDQINRNIDMQNAANRAAGIENIMKLGGAAVGVATGNPFLAASALSGQNLMSGGQGGVKTNGERSST